ncbi:MAG: PqqD family protein [Acidobacteria bacterium]|nr:PqqD family protein [Acidobacteriota bacterium]
MNNPQYPTARKAGLVVQEVPDEVLVYDLDTNKAHCLNKTAAAVWRFCDGKTSVPEIAQFLSSESGTNVDSDLVWLAIDQLNESSLLEVQVEPKFQGQSRREAIRKIGIASMIALPIVASLVAPKSAMASASCNCQGDAGTNNSLVCTTNPVGCPPHCNLAGICSSTPN